MNIFLLFTILLKFRSISVNDQFPLSLKNCQFCLLLVEEILTIESVNSIFRSMETVVSESSLIAMNINSNTNNFVVDFDDFSTDDLESTSITDHVFNATVGIDIIEEAVTENLDGVGSRDRDQQLKQVIRRLQSWKWIT